ncbi:hypothetical protein AQUCO_11100021v1 [Aquilegia coerulea]|uniref:Uncharacterized protein n=1 Tax=Aquilegia coerulea TaxID=218851 RepID=A0A2G5C2R2_AQUCA|nr:hypothetical protein AQUCO_11100021v1 [Aquilegia coerulea]
MVQTCARCSKLPYHQIWLLEYPGRTFGYFDMIPIPEISIFRLLNTSAYTNYCHLSLYFKKAPTCNLPM